MPTNRIDAIQQVQKIDQQFSRNQYNGGGQNDFVIKEGSIPVMISAPHSINHFRKGQLKLADKMTGGIALYLHQLTGCHVIYSEDILIPTPIMMLIPIKAILIRPS